MVAVAPCIVADGSMMVSTGVACTTVNCVCTTSSLVARCVRIESVRDPMAASAAMLMLTRADVGLVTWNELIWMPAVPGSPNSMVVALGVGSKCVFAPLILTVNVCPRSPTIGDRY